MLPTPSLWEWRVKATGQKFQRQPWWDVTEQRDVGNLNNKTTRRTPPMQTPAPANEGQRWQQQPWWWSVKQSKDDGNEGQRQLGPKKNPNVSVSLSLQGVCECVVSSCVIILICVIRIMCDVMISVELHQLWWETFRNCEYLTLLTSLNGDDLRKLPLIKYCKSYLQLMSWYYR